jgi:hypothetical protein
LRGVGIVWHRNVDLDVVCRTPPLKVSFAFDHEFDSASSMDVHSGFDPNQRLDGRRKTVRHQLKFAVGWDERNGSVVFES